MPYRYNPFTDKLDATHQEAITLNDLSDVTITTAADNHFLQYDNANSIWVNTLTPTFDSYATFQEISTPSNPPDNHGAMYAKDNSGVSEPYWLDKDGTETAILTTGSGAPIGASYVCISANGSLSAERTLTGTANQITVTDGGANSTVTLSTPQDIHTSANPTFAGLISTSLISVQYDAAPYIQLVNTTHTDDDEGRATSILFRGEQSGGEASNLVVFEAHHDGSSDDQKGELTIDINTGSSTTEALKIDSNLLATFAGSITSTSGNLTVSAGYFDLTEIADPGAPAGGTVRLFSIDEHFVALCEDDHWYDLSGGAFGTSSYIHTRPTLTDGGGLNITWGAAEIYDSFISGSSQRVDIAAEGSAQAQTANTMNWLFYDQSGTAFAQSTTEDDIDWGDGDFPVAAIATTHNDIFYTDRFKAGNQELHTIKRTLFRVFNAVVTDGLIASEHAGDNAFDIDMSAGHYIHLGYDVHTVSSAIDSTVTAIYRWYHNASNAWETDTNSQIDAANWDDISDSAGIQSNTAAKYYRSTFYTDGTNIHWVYPQVEYNTLNAALEADDPTPPDALYHFPKCTTLVMKGDDAALPAAGGDQWIDVRPIIGGTGTGGTITDHGNLAGLTDDDHTQYILADATRAMTDNWDMGNYTLTANGVTIDGTFTDGTLSIVGGEILDATTLEATTTLNLEIGDTAQVTLTDGVLAPTTDNDVDLGSASKEYKDLFIDGTANIDSLVADTADINGGTLDGVTIATDCTQTNWDAAYTHVSNDGSDHSLIDQDVTSGSSPTFTGTNITGVASFVVADESTDTTCFPVFVTAATGTLAPKSGSNLTFNSNTGVLGATLVDTDEIYNTSADLKIQPDVGGDIVCFGDTDVGDAVDGKSLIVHRKAAEGDRTATILVDQWMQAIFKGSGATFLQSGDHLYFDTAGSKSIYLDCGDHYYFRDTDAADAVRMQLNSADGNLTLNGTFTLTATTGVNMSAASGILTIAGIGGSNNESVTIDCEQADIVDITSGKALYLSSSNSSIIALQSANYIILESAGAAAMYFDAGGNFLFRDQDDSDTTRLTLDSATGNMTMTGTLTGMTVLEVPNGAGGTTVDAAGEICVDTTSRTLNFYDGTAEVVLNPEKTICFAVKNPTSSDDYLVWRFEDAVTITAVHGCCMDGTSIEFKVNECDGDGDNAAQICNTVTATTSDTSGTITNAAIDAGDYMSYTCSANNGSVTKAIITVNYRLNA